MDSKETARHFDELARDRKSGQGFSCGWTDRYRPTLLTARPTMARELSLLFSQAFGERSSPGGAILDIGCATMFYGSILEDLFTTVVGVDIAREMVAAAHPGPALAQASGCRLPFGDGSFQAVLLLDVLHHSEESTQLLEEAHRVLAAPGRLVVVEPNPYNPGMFLAHAVPREERQAVTSAWPHRLRRQISAIFGPSSVELQYVNLSFSTSFGPLAQYCFPFGPPARHRFWRLRSLVYADKAGHSS